MADAPFGLRVDDDCAASTRSATHMRVTNLLFPHGIVIP